MNTFHPTPPPPARRKHARFALPPSVGADEATQRAERLEAYLSKKLGTAFEVVVAESYESLARDLLAGRIDAAWAPPFVCARIEAMGVRVLVRGIRQGAASYRAALVCRRGTQLSLDNLSGKKAVWTDRQSVGGYLLAVAYLRAKGVDPSRVLESQAFAGSYRAALEAVVAGQADLTSIFAPPARAPNAASALSELLPHQEDAIDIVAYTEESPNDGVAVSMSASVEWVAQLEKTFLALTASGEGQSLLKDTFNAEAFETAPRMGYRSLYRVALAGS